MRGDLLSERGVPWGEVGADNTNARGVSVRGQGDREDVWAKVWGSAGSCSSLMVAERFFDS